MKEFGDVYTFGTLDIDGKKFPKVLLGTSPFLGAGQFGAKSYVYYRQFYENPKNITKIVVECVKLGCNAVQAICCPPVVTAIRDAVEATENEIFIMGSTGLGGISNEIEQMKQLKAQSIVTHGSYTDRTLNRDPEKLRQTLQAIKDEIAGIASHTPGTIVEKAALMEEVKLMLVPFNKIGLFMDPSFELTVQAAESARRVGKKIIAMKSLAAGKLEPAVAFQFLQDRVDGVAVGLTSMEEIKETLKVARSYFG